MAKEDTTEQRDATYRKVVAILKSDRAHWWQAERIVGLMCGYDHIGGQKQDAGDDKPFDLRSPGDLIRIDVKTQQSNELDVKKEKPGKQFMAWHATNKRFIPLQVVLDSLSEGWYFVPGIPLRTAEVYLDPLVRTFDTENPTRPFQIGKCLLAQLSTRERFDDMVTQLKEALKTIEEHREPIQAAVDEEHLRYVASIAEDTLGDTRLMAAIVDRMGDSDHAADQLAHSKKVMSRLARSDEAINQLAQSDEAISRLAQSDAAISRLAQSDAAISKLAQSKEAMRKLAQSDEAINQLAQSDEAMQKLVQSEAAISKFAESNEAVEKFAQSDTALANLSKAAKKDPTLRAKLLALLNEAESDESSS